MTASASMPRSSRPKGVERLISLLGQSELSIDVWIDDEVYPATDIALGQLNQDVPLN